MAFTRRSRMHAIGAFPSKRYFVSTVLRTERVEKGKMGREEATIHGSLGSSSNTHCCSHVGGAGAFGSCATELVAAGGSDPVVAPSKGARFGTKASATSTAIGEPYVLI